MKKLFVAVGLGVLFLGLGNVVHSADIEAVLDSDDGSSGFVVQDSGTTELFRARSDGNVGINDTTPDAQLEVLSNSAPDGYIVAVSSQNDTTGNIFSIKGNGNVGVGTSNPGAKLDVNGSITTSSVTASGFYQLASKTGAQLLAITPSALGQMYWNSDAGKMFISTGTVNAGSFAASDDYTEGP